ncbi:hypothetical protein DdX_20186 [Ditylenchus destructor]|uniref:Uncharacterized protein n=1 Tax=Ditylenchus destructor TaxID=166010 RepID=A0AAD4QWL5_9BILA|nr:hypothetical protein DdX_20186 [Ditylenchus destructor]
MRCSIASETNHSITNYPNWLVAWFLHRLNSTCFIFPPASSLPTTMRNGHAWNCICKECQAYKRMRLPSTPRGRSPIRKVSSTKIAAPKRPSATSTKALPSATSAKALPSATSTKALPSATSAKALPSATSAQCEWSSFSQKAITIELTTNQRARERKKSRSR